MRGAVRRLLKGLPRTSVEQIATRFGASVIPWDFVDLIDRDPSRRVRLRIEQDRLSQMHPSDIADILEDLAPAERQALFVSLDEEVAAEALEEVKPKMQQSLIESLDSEEVAAIVEEMDPGAAADLLSELSDERSEAILEEMDPEERQEVEDLLEFSGNSAAGRMTTEYIALPRRPSSIRPSTHSATSKGTSTPSPTSICSTTRSGSPALFPSSSSCLRSAEVPLSSLAARPHRHLRRRCQRPQSSRTLRQIQPPLSPRRRPRKTARRRRSRRTGHRASTGQPLKYFLKEKAVPP